MAKFTKWQLLEIDLKAMVAVWEDQEDPYFQGMKVAYEGALDMMDNLDRLEEANAL